MATTLSLVVIFLPIAFMNGYAKRFINPFGWTMAFLDPGVDAGQLHADADAQLTIPAVVGRVSDHKTKEQGFFHWVDTFYTRQVRWALDHPGAIFASPPSRS
jgi:HAE1 family hydrophobic/amphiphilic exporter-1